MEHQDNRPTLPDISPEHREILHRIEGELTPQQLNVARLIARIPYGTVASYETIRRWAAAKYNYTGIAIAVGRARGKLYCLLTHETDFPLHRVATHDDDITQDSEDTQADDIEKRTREGTWPNPVWFDPDDYNDPYP